MIYSNLTLKLLCFDQKPIQGPIYPRCIYRHFRSVGSNCLQKLIRILLVFILKSRCSVNVSVYIKHCDIDKGPVNSFIVLPLSVYMYLNLQRVFLISEVRTLIKSVNRRKFYFCHFDKKLKGLFCGQLFCLFV